MTAKRIRILLIMTALLAVFCLVFISCGNNDAESSGSDASVAEEQAASDDETAEDVAPAEDAEKEAAAEAEEETAEEQPQAEEKKEEKKSEKSKKKSDSKSKDKSKDKDKKDSSSEKKTEKKKVWVEPVTETRTVTLDTGTRYCNGANSNGGCGASWHGSKDGTYSEWKSHWQAYVKKRTAEEAEKGKTYVCDHIHDDSRWVPDTTTEEVVVQEGYWKEVD